MAASSEPRSGLSYGWTLGENNWNTAMDNNILWLGRFATHLSVKDRDLATPPGSPVSGDTYIVATGGTGSWSGQSGKVAIWSGSAWVFGTPRTGWLAYIEDEQKMSVYRSSAWSAGIAI
jgi:hypothetical protein